MKAGIGSLFVAAWATGLVWTASSSRADARALCLRPEDECAFSGRVYELGSRKGEVLYRWELHYVDGDRNRWKSFFTDPAGNVVAEDELLLSKGHFAAYRYARHNIDEHAEVRIRGGKIIFEQEWRNRKRRNEEPYANNFVTGPYLVVYILRNWDTLVRGESLKVRFGVPDQLRSYEFRLTRDPEKERGGENKVVIRMAASSFVVRLFVDPVFLEFSAEERTLRRIIGRTLPVQARGERVVPVDADIRIEWQDRNFYVR